MLAKSLVTIRKLISYSPYQLFQERNLLYQCTSDKLKDYNFVSQQSVKMNGSTPLSVYCGYDPTAESLHLGNLVSIIMMARLQYFLKLRPIFLIGGATGLIGDPSGKKQQRLLMQQTLIQKNLQSIESEIKVIYDKICEDLISHSEDYGIKQSLQSQVAKPLFVDNFNFYKNMNVLTYLRDIGKVLRMNNLLTKQIVANRLQSDNGLSYTQFSYSILQSYDFYMLNKNYGCVLQFGGSDQWGNITNGCDLIRKLSKGLLQGYGITMPLLLTKTGEKFGKSEGNALYLNNKKTPTASIYDYLYSTPDSQIQKLLYIFTLYSPSRIQAIMSDQKRQPEKRLAQKILATKLTNWLGEYQNIKEQIIKLNHESLKNKNDAELTQIYNLLPQQMRKQFLLPQLLNKCKNLPDLLVQLGLCKSRNQARRDIEGQGISINALKIPKTSSQRLLIQLLNQSRLNGNYTLIRKGKKKFFLLKTKS